MNYDSYPLSGHGSPWEFGDLMKAVDTRKSGTWGPAMPMSRKPALDHEPLHPTKGTERLVVGLMEGQADGLGHFSVAGLGRKQRPWDLRCLAGQRP